MTKPPDLPAAVVQPGRLLTAEAFQRLADAPPELEWFANLGNAATRRAYENALKDFMGFMGFTGNAKPEEFRSVTRAHVIAWRGDLAAAGHGDEDGGALFRPLHHSRAEGFGLVCRSKLS